MAHEIISAPLPLSPGTYRLTEDVKNPKPDGRIQQNRNDNWESWKVWPKGKLFIVDLDRNGRNRVYVWGGYHKAEHFMDDPRLPVLIEYLERIEETPSRFLARHALGSEAGGIALAVLDKLNIPLADIQAAIDAIDAEERENWK